MGGPASYQLVVLEPIGRSVKADVVLWNYGSLLSAPTHRHAGQVQTEVENLTKQFITQWNLAEACRV
jgi:hypothetical protein